MKNFTLQVIIILSSVFVHCSQQEQFFFTFDQIPLDQINSLEKKFDSELKIIETPIFISSDFIPDEYLDNLSPFPIIYSRKDESFSLIPEVEIEYHYDEPDSVLRLITYTWSTNKIGTNLENINSDFDKDLGKFNEQFDFIQKQITTKLGKPTISDHHPRIKKESDHKHWLERVATWKLDNKVVELRLTFTKGFERGTHRLRTKVYWTKK